jgi:hypothetical protein
MKAVAIGDFLTESQLRQAMGYCETLHGPAVHTAIRDNVIAPNMDEINRKIGQENDPDFLAYAIEHVYNVESGGAS